MEGKARGNAAHEEQLYDAICYAVEDLREAHRIVAVLGDSDFSNSGTRAWKYLQQRYDRISESKVQRLLDAHRRRQGDNESIAAYLQRYQLQHEELKIYGHPMTELTTTSSMVDGLRTEFKEIKQCFRIHRKGTA